MSGICHIVDSLRQKFCSGQYFVFQLQFVLPERQSGRFACCQIEKSRRNDLAPDFTGQLIIVIQSKSIVGRNLQIQLHVFMIWQSPVFAQNVNSFLRWRWLPNCIAMQLWHCNFHMLWTVVATIPISGVEGETARRCSVDHGTRPTSIPE